MASFSVDSLHYFIRSRRSTKPRLFNGMRIEDDLVWQILENARWAPSHGLTQPWHFKVYTGLGLKSLANFQATWYQATMSPEQLNPDKLERLKTNVMAASHVIVLCMKRQLSETIPEIEEIEAVACAVQNMALTASAYGICSFWGSGGPTYTEAMKTFLGLEERDRCLGYLYLGYSDTPTTTSPRIPIQAKVEWIDQ
ncbi:MAG: nitroreductase [Leptolyngbyaceae bacterium]|nr:nitroreductase [Leptolyngbyaceae bacterium]